MENARQSWACWMLLMCCAAVQADDAAAWTIAEGPLQTRWAKDVDPDNVLPEYPRPQMQRAAWSNLNGLWQYAVRPASVSEPPQSWDGELLVPFPIESALSGVMRTVDADQALWYQREFRLPSDWKGQRILLHFGAVDWRATVWVNGRQIIEHEGGYDPFSAEITDALTSEEAQVVTVRVWDPTDRSWQPRGKQISNPHGIWYTAVTGIWQTVWLEPVPASSIERLSVSPDFDQKNITVRADVVGEAGRLKVEVLEDGRIIATATAASGQPLTLNVPSAKSWSPDDPHLYDLRVALESQGGVLDTVNSYFGMRKVELKPDQEGVPRLWLNNRPLFQYGLLDQGWWPDGLYTAPSDEALRYDIEITRQCGFNMCRKHVKVEPQRWYYWCDRLGLLVWQDMPSGDRYIGGNEPDIVRSPESQANFDREWKAIIDANRHHPSIVVWVPFNEGWGQSDTTRILDWTRDYDPTRLVDGPSGWADRGSGDMYDRHEYPGPGMFPIESRRASVLGEFGGLGWPVKGHLWQADGNWGYRTHASQEELQRQYEQLITALRPLIGRGLAAAVYTQTTDVEGEVNGLMTYDRAVLKMDAAWLAKIHAPLYGPPPTVKEAAPTSQREAISWKYTFSQPNASWSAADFDDTTWQEGSGGFGTRETPGAVVRTVWDTSDIWLRRQLDWPAGRGDVYLTVHHDEDAEVYLNGHLAAKLDGYTTGYTTIPINADALAALSATEGGSVVIAIHCRQTDGGQYIDAGLVRIVEATTEEGR